MLKAIFFDFDGTIIDTETPEVEAWRVIFSEHGLEYPDDHWKFCIGRGAEQIMETPLELLQRLSGRPIEVPNRHERLMSVIDRQPVRPGVTELLDECAAAGIRCAVVSSSKRFWVEGHLTRFGLATRFVDLVCAEDAARAKPFPDLYVTALDRVGVDPAQVVAIEDSPNGVTAASSAGITTILFPNPLTAQLQIVGESMRLDGSRLVDLATARALLRENAIGHGL